jgi:hypothetical protein
MPDRERQELEVALEARRELGEELEPEIIDSFVERIERRIDERAKELAQARRPRAAGHPDWGGVTIAIVSLGIALSVLEKTSLAGEVIAWIAIVLVNVAYYRRGRW